MLYKTQKQRIRLQHRHKFISCKKGMVINMKIGEARKTYVNHINQLQKRRKELLKQKKENEKSQNQEANEGVILELSKIEKQYDMANDFMEKFSAYTAALENAEAAKRQGEAVEEAADEVAKCLEIARRIANGDKVPAYDEKKLLEYSHELYMAAKNTAFINANKKHKEYDSLWKEEDESLPENEKSISETVNEMECPIDMPS